MSAREELFESLTPQYRAQLAPGEEDSANALLDAYRDEVLREAAERIRAEIRNATGNPTHDPAWAQGIAIVDHMANLIDPAKQP